MYEFLQRPTSKGRREGTADYIRDRIGPTSFAIGAFPAICIGMVRPAAFAPIRQEGQVSLPANFGVLQLALSKQNTRVLLDGLARVTGAVDLFEEAGEQEVGEWFTFPVTFYAPKQGRVLTLSELGQLFHDFNFLQTRVNPNQAIALDMSDIYITLTNRIGKSELIKRFGGIEIGTASLGKKSAAIVVQRVLLRFVRGACEGRQFQESNLSRVETPNLTKETLATLQTKLEDFIGLLAQRMGENRFTDRESLHVSAAGWQVIGLVYHDIAFRLKDRVTMMTFDDIITKLAGVDWSRYNPDWIGLIGEPERDAVTKEEIRDSAGRVKVSLTRAGRTTIANMLQYVRGKTGIDRLLLEAGQQDEVEAQGAMVR